MEQSALVEALFTVSGASIAIAGLVEVTKRISKAFGRWRAEFGEALAAAYGLVGLPAYATLVYGFDPVAFVLAAVVGAQAGVAAGAGYDALSQR